MRNRTTTTLLAFLVTVLASPAEAGSRNDYGKSHGYSKHAPVRHHEPYRPARAYRHGHPKVVYHKHGHHHDALTLAAGAVILGSLVTTLNYPAQAGVRVAGPAWAVRNPYPTQQNRWYQRDAYGDCFEVRLVNGGRQVWTLSHPANCR